MTGECALGELALLPEALHRPFVVGNVHAIASLELSFVRRDARDFGQRRHGKGEEGTGKGVNAFDKRNGGTGGGRGS